MWKDIEGHPGYQAHPDGRIRSIDREVNHTGRWGNALSRFYPGGVLKFDNKICPAGYYNASLGRGKSVLVHRIIALTFVKGRTSTKNQVNHKNGNRLDNRAENLEWVTPKQNIRHAIDRGSFVQRNTKAGIRWSGSKNPKAKLTSDDVKKIRSLYKTGLTQTKIGQMFGVTQAAVSSITRNESWSKDRNKSRSV